MNQALFEQTAAGRSQNQKLRDYLTERPHQWLAMPELAKVITPTGIGAAVHSRINDVRLKWDLCVEHASKHPGTGERGSWYYFNPDLTWTQHLAQIAAQEALLNGQPSSVPAVTLC